jgi:DNA-binding NtrC family response regulator
MSLTVVLAVGLDSSLLASLSSVWQSAGFIVASTGSISDAIIQIRDGDFDLVLLGHSIPTDSRERLTFQIRANGLRTPVVSITDSSTGCDSFADATIRNEPTRLLQSIGELMAERAKSPAPSRAMPGIAA